ncbi:MAG: type II toxin-antitoxin system RelE/ParE family toxin [Pyrinomonadaceae bacterium]|nr:type II toxin-antitoxin system RelE/ParE family toxin [Pyrinomonadaceae bacterium]
MACEVEYTDEFEEWWNELSSDEQATVDAYVKMLEEFGISLGYPYSSDIRGSRYAQMRELRPQHRGRPFRVLYAFDPRRMAILLIGGDKTGNKRWYEQFVPIADRLYERHLEELEKEGLIDG